MLKNLLFNEKADESNQIQSIEMNNNKKFCDFFFQNNFTYIFFSSAQQ